MQNKPREIHLHDSCLETAVELQSLILNTLQIVATKFRTKLSHKFRPNHPLQHPQTLIFKFIRFQFVNTDSSQHFCIK